MQIVTYLGFTLLSIFIQFSVIDFIQGRLKVDENPIETKVSQKRQLRDVLKDVAVKPHALYYRSNKGKGIEYVSPAKFISNLTLTEILSTTDLTTTVFDILYDENTTSTDESFTTESLYTTSDIENITEITFIEKDNKTIKTDAEPREVSEDCSCNFLIRVCDINCCCDKDCSDLDIKLFPNCVDNKSTKEENVEDYCLSQIPYFSYGNDLFCIVKVNLPENKKKVIQKTEPVLMNPYLTWKSNEKSQILYEFSNSLYKYADPIWLFKNGTIYHTDLPVPTFTNYCTGRKAMQFLKDEKHKCNVKLQDLEMFQIMKGLEEVSVISATPLSMNSSVLNCSTLHCVNWTIVVCRNLVCENYTKKLHDPTCNESICTNLAPKIEYILYYHESKIINATIQFHLEDRTMGLPFLSQEIVVKFIVGNKPIDKVIKLSGNPGYLEGLPMIISYAEKNYTDAFFNSTTQSLRHLILPENNNGLCTVFNSSENFVLFGRNRRTNCRYNHKPVTINNASEECNRIQSNISRYLDLAKRILVSPLGNPQQLKDSDWISIEKSVFEGPLYGRLQDSSSKLLCFNLVSRFSMIFSYAQINDNNRIVSANYATTASNATFNMDDMAVVITFDISFVDVTKPSVSEGVTSESSLNIHLPDDFFYPFRSNEPPILKLNVFTMILCFISLISCK